MKYDNSLGIFGNIEKLFSERNKTNNMVYNNKANQDAVNANTEDIMCELDTVDRIAEIEEALCELDERIGGNL